VKGPECQASAETRETASSAERRESWREIVLLPPATWQAAVEGPGPGSAQRRRGRMRSNRCWREGGRKEINLHVEGDGTLEEQEAELVASWDAF